MTFRQGITVSCELLLQEALSFQWMLDAIRPLASLRRHYRRNCRPDRDLPLEARSRLGEVAD